METPEKFARPPWVRNRNTAAASLRTAVVEYPEKYLMLCKFFNVIVSVIPLLRMRWMSPTFTNICPQIQSLTDRSFTIAHLAQMKYILSEAIRLKRIRVRDEQTECMKEELLITKDNMKDIKGIFFRSRLEDYCETHAGANDIPEGELPALFCQSNHGSCVLLATPIKHSSSSVVMEDCSEGTPAKEALSPIRLMVTGSAIKPGDDTCDIPTKLARRPNPSRSLKFDAPEVRGSERKIVEERDPAISQARRRHQLMSGVTKLFNMINILFQSINQPVMTKEELL